MGLQEARARAASAVNKANQQHEARSKKRGYDKGCEEREAPGGRNKRTKNFKSRDKRSGSSKIKNPCGLCKNGNQHKWSNCWFNRFNKKNRPVDGKVPDNLKHLVKPKDGGHNQAITGNEGTEDLVTGFASSDEDTKGKPLRDISNECYHSNTHSYHHHLDCFTMQDLENQHPNTNLELGTTTSTTSSTTKNPSGQLGGCQIPESEPSIV